MSWVPIPREMASKYKQAPTARTQAGAIAICGHNEQLVAKLDDLKKPFKNVNMKAFGFVNNVYEYMSISDMLISKSGE